MKKTLITLLAALCCHTMQAQEQQPTMAQLFKTMPESVLPYLTTNNRLDLIDFIEAGMKAEVTNRLDGTTSMTALTTDSLSLCMNPSLHIDMKLRQSTEGSSQVIDLRRTFTVGDSLLHVVTDTYSTEWQKLTTTPGPSTLLTMPY